MPTRLWKWPCGALVPSIVWTNWPSALNTSTTLLPGSPTNTLPADGLPEAPTAMLVGLENWPGPEPGMPAWQVRVQTSLCALPSLTPHPNAARKLPIASNLSTRALPGSATNTLPLVCWIATPIGVVNCPAPAPGVPKLLIGLNNDACAVAAPSANVKAPTAKAILATRGGPTPPTRQRATRLAVSVLPATGSTKRDRLMRASSPPFGCLVAGQVSTGMSVLPLVLAMAPVNNKSSRRSRRWSKPPVARRISHSALVTEQAKTLGGRLISGDSVNQGGCGSYLQTSKRHVQSVHRRRVSTVTSKGPAVASQRPNEAGRRLKRGNRPSPRPAIRSDRRIMLVRPGPAIEPHLLGIEALLPIQVARHAPRTGERALLVRLLVDALGDAGLLADGRWHRRGDPRRCALARAWLCGQLDREVALPVALVADALGVDPAVLAAAVARAPSVPAPPRRRGGLRRATSGAAKRQSPHVRRPVEEVLNRMRGAGISPGVAESVTGTSRSCTTSLRGRSSGTTRSCSNPC